MKRASLRKYFIMGSQDCPPGREPADILSQAIAGGITIFQYREKGAGSLEGAEKIALGKKLRAICRDAGIPFIINNDVDLIDELDVDGIHVGQTDTSVSLLREKYPDLIIGLSVSNKEELTSSPLDLVDYLGAGAVYPTSSKHDAIVGEGLEWIRQLRSLQAHIPFVGIGGITVDRAAEVIAAGADGVAVISAITQADNIAKAVAKL